MNFRVHATDERSIEVLASGLAMNHGAQFAVDITLRSAVTAIQTRRQWTGQCSPKPDLKKETKYAELVESDRCQLVVVGIENGGTVEQ